MSVPDLTVGDSEQPWLDVAPYQLGDTTATLTLHAPTDTDPTGTDIPLDGGVETVVDGLPVLRFTTIGLVQYTAAGWWVRSWTVTGVGASQPDERFFVAPNPTAGGPLWTPTRERVADYVRHRTVPVDFETEGEPTGTFSATTTPPGSSVDRLITGAVGWVLAATGDLDSSLTDAAQECAALRAAGFVELAGRPPVDSGLATALFAQADTALKALVARNEALTGSDPDEPVAVFEIVQPYSCPTPRWYGDCLL